MGITVAEYKRLSRRANTPDGKRRYKQTHDELRSCVYDAQTFVLPVCPSVNNLYFNRRGGGRGKSSEYRAWIKSALGHLLSQRATPCVTPCSVSVTLPMSTRGDADGRLKACLDLLVRAEIIPDDSSRYVPAMSVSFGQVESMHVCVAPFVERKAA